LKLLWKRAAEARFAAVGQATEVMANVIDGRKVLDPAVGQTRAPALVPVHDLIIDLSYAQTRDPNREQNTDPDNGLDRVQNNGLLTDLTEDQERGLSKDLIVATAQLEGDSRGL
jgi:hypothetical protein